MYISLCIDISRKTVEYVALGMIIMGGAYLAHELMKEDAEETPEVNPID